MTVFLDVGGHDGQTLDEVIKPRWSCFDHIYSFEPMPFYAARLAARFEDEPRVSILDYGLAHTTGEFPLYGTNDIMESSMFAAKNDVDDSVVTPARFVEASEWFRENLSDQQAVVKLNCEGAEAPILENLIASGQIWSAAFVMIDFDVRKIPGEEHREKSIIAQLDDIGFTRYALTEHVLIGRTHQDRIAHWLEGLNL